MLKQYFGYQMLQCWHRSLRRTLVRSELYAATNIALSLFIPAGYWYWLNKYPEPQDKSAKHSFATFIFPHYMFISNRLLTLDN